MTAGEVLAFPTRAPLEPDNVPLELRERPQWVRFKWDPPNVKGKRSKVPWHPTENRGASSTDPATWGTFADAVSHVGQHGTAGIGYVFCKADGYARGKGEDDAAFSARLARLAEHADNYTAIDFDACLTDSGYLTPTVAEWVGRLDSYAEVSISGTGLHIIVRGGIPDGRGRKRDGIEVYDRGRYFTFTGDLLDGEPRQVRDANGALTELLALLDKPAPSSANEPAAVTGSAELPPSTLSRHERLLARSVILARAGEPEPSIYAALAAWRDLLGGEPGERVIPDSELRNLARSAVEKFGAGEAESEHNLPHAVDLYGPTVTPTAPGYTVPGLLRRKGLHLIWAQPGGLKTYTLLWLAHALLTGREGDRLFDHPELTIPGPFGHVLWVGTEEDAGSLRYRADKVRRGMGDPPLGGRLSHVFASEHGRRVTLDHLPLILDADGPAELLVLDSLTGLRPKTVNGQRVKWDLDNDAANETCLALRGLAEAHDLAIILVHHTGRDTAKGYRGPTDWWASADVMFGLVPDSSGRVNVRTRPPEGKNRDGKILDPFTLEPSWTGDAFTLRYVGATASKLSANAERVMAVIRSRYCASQTTIAQATGLSRPTAQRAIAECRSAQLIVGTSEVENRSPVYKLAEGEA